MSDGIPTEAVKLHVTCRGDTGKILQKCNVSTLEQSRTVHYFVAAKSVLGLSTSRSKPSQIRDCLDPFDMPIALIELELNICNDSVQFRMEMRKISRRRSRSSWYTELCMVISRSCFPKDGEEMYKDL